MSVVLLNHKIFPKILIQRGQILHEQLGIQLRKNYTLFFKKLTICDMVSIFVIQKEMKHLKEHLGIGWFYGLQ